MKQSIPKTDKKKKKEFAIEIEELEEDLKVRQEQEIDEFDRKHKLNQTNDAINGSGESSENNNKEFKPSKSARRRENKERKAKEQQERIASGAMDDSDNLRQIELRKIEEILLQRDYFLVDVASDGDCMYKALEHQLKITRSRDVPVKDLRKNASEFILKNKDEFWPFLTNDNGDMFSDVEFNEYCNKVANTKTWGGQLELKALSNVLQAPIEVIQSEGAPVEIGFEEYGSKNPLVLW